MHYLCNHTMFPGSLISQPGAGSWKNLDLVGKSLMASYFSYHSWKWGMNNVTFNIVFFFNYLVALPGCFDLNSSCQTVTRGKTEGCKGSHGNQGWWSGKTADYSRKRKIENETGTTCKMFETYATKWYIQKHIHNVTLTYVFVFM